MSASPTTPSATQPAAVDLVLIGGGGHALVVAEAAVLAGMTLAGFLDDNPHGRLAATTADSLRAPCLGRLEDLSLLRQHLERGGRWIIAVGDLGLRSRLLLGMAQRDRLNAAAATVIHPSAWVSPSATVGPGAYIGPRAVVHSRAAVGPHAIINSGAIVEHECRVGENAHIAPGAVLGGSVTVGAGCLIGMGARVLPNLTVGQGGVVGAGGVVVRSVPAGSTVVGVPASPISAASSAPSAPPA